ncbi:hypothetical protein [Desulfolutivibrio sulfoxidireducens]|uniref:hypothetical protein n=1 Tax=Desulfolutivibrio sulfoxidireducens TaxID=2773299 RepID=UPI00159D7DBB|nr:hypothetical protein [Desulfolutivibrio sulfoxidireducens]QLA20937.1 hypothetical protein GD604_15020 [Desulfolutivibrio sulfoxidireducens]
MNFRKHFPNYQNQSNSPYYMNSVPLKLKNGLNGFLFKIAQDDDLQISLKQIINMMAMFIPCEPTTNWGHNFLLTDLDSYLGRLTEKKNFHKFMDFILEISSKHFATTQVDELNSLFEDYEFGYHLVHCNSMSTKYTWKHYKQPDNSSEVLEITIEEVKNICLQSSEHIQQIVTNLSKKDNPRSYKDALRDALSSLEAITNHLGGYDKIEDSVTSLKKIGTWGDVNILNDIIRIWKHIHYKYKDIRHGNSTNSIITHEEVQYYVEHIMAIVSYLSRRHNYIMSQSNFFPNGVSI